MTQSQNLPNRWMILARANFLVLTVLTVLAGLSAALYEHISFNIVNAVLTLAGALLAHTSANVFNNYFDYKMGVDQITMKTPFSGGVDVIVGGQVKPSSAFLFGLLCLLGATLVGAYFVLIFPWPMFVIVAYGGLSICLYIPCFSRVPGVSEIIAGTSFGFMALGTYVIQAGAVSATAASVFILVSLLVGILLFLNEFPDTEPDRLAGRKHAMLMLGKKRASRVYILALACVYTSIVLSILIDVTPLSSLMALGTLPLASKAGRIVAKEYDQIESLKRALALNVSVVLGTIGLTSLGLITGIFL